MRKKTILFIVLLLYAAVFCIIMVSTILTPARVYDDPQLLAKNQNSANKINYKLSRHDGTTTVTCEKMQGMDIIWEYKADEDMLYQMNYNLDVTGGKAKLILIQPDNAIITLVEHDSNLIKSANTFDETSSAEENTVELELKKGINRIKIVCGKGTAFSLNFRIK